MIGRASISMRNLSFAVRIENPPGIDCGLFGGYKETDPRNIMFCTLRNFSPPCAVNAAFARSSGVLSAVITTAGGAAAAVVVAGAEPFAGPCSCAETTPARQTNSARDFNNWLFIYKPFLRSSIAPVRKCVDCRRLYYHRRHQTHQTLAPLPTTHQNSATRDCQRAARDSHGSEGFGN